MGTSLRERRRHRSWPEALKREIVAATLVPGSSASIVARQYDVNVNQVFAWRKRYRSEATEPTELQLLPVTVTPDQPAAPTPVPVNDVIVQEALGRDPHAGDLYVFRGARGDLIKIIWHDGIGMSLYSKRLEQGRFLWPSPADGTVAISAAQLAYMLDGIDWRNPRHTFRPQRAG